MSYLVFTKYAPRHKKITLSDGIIEFSSSNTGLIRGIFSEVIAVLFTVVCKMSEVYIIIQPAVDTALSDMCRSFTWIYC